jgi:hypothetical protein
VIYSVAVVPRLANGLFFRSFLRRRMLQSKLYRNASRDEASSYRVGDHRSSTVRC